MCLHLPLPVYLLSLTLSNSESTCDTLYLAIRQQVLGPQHPHTARSLNNLATLYYNLGQYEDALSLLQQAVAIRQQVLGSEHPHTATSLNNLAILYNRLGRYEQA